jgi:hypothetical protein
MARFVDSASGLRVSVSSVRFAEARFGGSMPVGPTPVRCSQFAKPGSVEPAFTCGSCRSAPADGARLSGTHARGGVVCTAATVGSVCGLKVDRYIVVVCVTGVCTSAVVECFAEAGCVVGFAGAEVVGVCGACDVVGAAVVGWPGNENRIVGSGKSVCRSGCATLAAATAVDGASAVTATRAAAAPAHAASVAIGASRRPRPARGPRGLAERMGRDTGRDSGSATGLRATGRRVGPLSAYCRGGADSGVYARRCTVRVCTRRGWTEHQVMPDYNGLRQIRCITSEVCIPERQVIAGARLA